ncbi:MAG: ornithine cyclodeaminase family protein [Bacteroidales bacterium]|jgi:ornithine cyclodeaminase/alanine dehydrogenase|nr:ornithine cyclodeaminase family protein [Bacteroidales bacterium]
MQNIKILTSEEIKDLVSMKEAIDVMKLAFSDLSMGKYRMPVRTVTDFGNGAISLFFKPSFLPQEERIGIKLLSQTRNKPSQGSPAIQGIMVLIDSATNSIIGLLDGSYLTALRTGAASGIATRLLSRSESSVLALFGAGAQGYTQFEAVCCERDIRKAYIYDTSSEAADRFIAFFKAKTDVELLHGADLSSLREADIICTATNSGKPLFQTDMLKKGVHINAIGSYKPQMHELPDDLFSVASLYVDHKDSCFSESGDIITPLEKGIFNHDNYKGEIGELISSRITGRISSDQITVFKSVGVAVQDLAMASFAYRKACDAGIGQDIKL